MLDNNKTRNLIKVKLNELFDKQNISQIIKNTTEEFRLENECSVWDINNGLCSEFAEAVIEKMGGTNNNLYELSGDMFFAFRDPEYAKNAWGNIIETKYGVWSVELLKYYGYPPNIDLNLVNDEINHTWIYFNGKHYDAEVPNGVDKWYELPLISEFFSGFNK